MELLFVREQKEPIWGKEIEFHLTVTANLSEEEAEAITKYNFRYVLLCRQPPEPANPDSFWSRLWHRLMCQQIVISHLVRGVSLHSTSILEMRQIEDRLRQSVEGFEALVSAAREYEGESLHTFRTQ